MRALACAVFTSMEALLSWSSNCCRSPVQTKPTQVWVAAGLIMNLDGHRTTDNCFAIKMVPKEA